MNKYILLTIVSVCVMAVSVGVSVRLYEDNKELTERAELSEGALEDEERCHVMANTLAIEAESLLVELHDIGHQYGFYNDLDAWLDGTDTYNAKCVDGVTIEGLSI